MYVRNFNRRFATRYIRYISRQVSSAAHEDGVDKAAILNASLEHVPEHGWSPVAIEHGAVSLGLPGVSHGVCNNGAMELIEHFESQCNTRLVDYLIKETEQQPRVKTPQLIRNAVEYRLKMLVPYISRWPEALSIKAHPSHAASSLHTLAGMLDDVWYHAGDRSTDFNWYTKRALLGAVYCSTELYMTQDTSVNFHDTWQFLSRRLEDVATVGMTTKQVTELSEGAWLVAAAGVTTALNMLNLNPTKR